MHLGISGINGRVGQVIVQSLGKYPDIKLVAGLCKADMDGAVCKVTSDMGQFLDSVNMVIDFSSPENFVTLAQEAKKHSTAIVSGTTGLSVDETLLIEGAAKNVPILHAGNMSLGVNLLCALVEESAARLGARFDIEINETHHKMKKDAPSGTALMLGHAAAEGRKISHEDHAVYSREGTNCKREENEIGYSVRRGGSVVGAHDVSFFGPGEEITLSHRAEDRSLFAEGAIFAAQWLIDQPSGKLYSMRDALGL